jgi:small multidrug resistance family-3 protein
MMGKVKAVKSIIYFVLAGLCEIGGGYLVWLWLREGKPIRQYSGSDLES